LSFASIRPYVAGDDVRSIDWKVSARAGQTYVKEFVEERELTLMLIIDSSKSLGFGSQGEEKQDSLARIAAVLAYAASFNNDKAGLIVFSDKIETYLAPKKGKKHILSLISIIEKIVPSGKSDLGLALQVANRFLRTGAIVFIFSDFMFDTADYQSNLLLLSKKHETTGIVFSDPLEQEIPDVGLLTLMDSETGAVRVYDTSSKKAQKHHHENRTEFTENLRKTFQKAGASLIEAPVDGDYIRALSHFFQQQARRR
jgi:uncharacterized protein (DUF58 family)